MIFFSVLLSYFEGYGFNREGRESREVSYYVCFEGAARFYQVSEWLLWAIAKVESGFNPYAVNRNRDGSRDLGLMQINTRWVSELRRLGFIRDERDLFDPCVSVWAGAYILRRCVDEYGYSWEAVGCYHSRTKWRRDWYARKVYREIMRVMEARERGNSRGLN